MKTDFKLMKALQAHTLVTPEVRQNAIINFVNRINSKIKKKMIFFFCLIYELLLLTFRS